MSLGPGVAAFRLQLSALSGHVRQLGFSERRRDLAADRKGKPRPILVIFPTPSPTRCSRLGCGAPGASMSSTACLTSPLRRKSYGFPSAESWVLKWLIINCPVRRLYQSLCVYSPALESLNKPSVSRISMPPNCPLEPRAGLARNTRGTSWIPRRTSP